MDTSALRVAGYRFRSTFGRRWPGCLAIVLLVGLVGGLAMGSIAAARRTQSSFTTYLASTNPSALTIAVFPGAGSASGPGGPYSTSLSTVIRRLPGVSKVESWVQPFGIPLGPTGRPLVSTGSTLAAVGSVDGLSFDIDRATPVAGRMADPRRADEFVTTEAGAQVMHWHVGQVVPVGFYTPSEFAAPGFASGGQAPAIRLDARLVGLVQFSDSIVEDEVDRYPTFFLFTPAITDTLVARGMTFASYFAIQTRDVSAVEQEFERVVPVDVQTQIHVTSVVTARTDRAIKPESIALGVFGLIAALAALAIGGQAVARYLRTGQADLQVLRYLGASPATTVSDGLIGALASVVLGALLAVLVAVALSPLGPIGPVRPVYPTPGVAVDWTVLGAGVAVIIVVLGTLAPVLAVRGEPHRVAGRRGQAPTRRAMAATAAASAGLPPSAVAGVRFALEPGDGRSSFPVRSALAGTVLGVVVVASTLTFGSGLSTLVSHPPLYGWNWTYALGSETGPDVPPQAVALLAHDKDVAAYSDAELADPQIDGVSVPAVFEPNGATVVPPILSGHAPTGDEIALGAATMRELHAHVGGTVIATYGSPKAAPLYVPPTSLRVVGTATLPAIGFPTSEGDHTAMGTGALISEGSLPASFQKAAQGPDPTLDGPEYVFVRMRSGLSQPAARADMGRIADAGNRAFATAPNGDGTGDTVLVYSNLLPAEIANYETIGATPALLAGSLAVGALAALALTLVASVRRRRRDLALLKSLGFTGGQVTTSVAVQATVIGLVGLVVGLPLGVALGRWLWVLFAQEISAVPDPTVPVVALGVVALAVLLLVNLVALGPGRAAARTPTALVLRAE